MSTIDASEQSKAKSTLLIENIRSPYVDVVVGIRTERLSDSFTYYAPPDFNLQVGHQVRVPFGKKEITGIVVALRQNTSLDYTKPVTSLVHESPVVSHRQLQLAYWMSEKYLSPIHEAISLMMPPGQNLKNMQKVSISRKMPKPNQFRTEGAKRLYEYLETKKSPLLAKTLITRLGPWARNALLTLHRNHLLKIHEPVPKQNTQLVSPSEPFVQLAKSNNSVISPILTQPQSKAVEKIKFSINSGSNSNKKFLLKGVTGSGKTEVYLQAISYVLSQGRQAVVLIPELSLTPQMLDRFEARFPGNVVAFHSGLSDSVHRKNWWMIHNKQANVVIGSRSALFAPHRDLGIIVIDEEHEWTYKQQEQQPRYHARDVAFRLSELNDCVVILGSATPDLSTYYSAQNGLIETMELPSRIQDSGAFLPLAKVSTVDMRMELKNGNRSIFSDLLKSSLIETYEQGNQSLLFLNRRGTANIVQCRSCGFSLKCSRCNIAYTFHAPNKLICHRCNKSRLTPNSCPNCKSSQIKYLGIGTQRVVDKVSELIPGAKILRWDRDTVKSIKDHEAILSNFASRKANILVGTQMIAKGLHLPNVTLVGVILADIGLNSADLRASERTFQVLTQVAGRAGRGESVGRVVIQTYNPEHYAIRSAAKQNYKEFYDKEIQFRRSLSYPPYSGQIRLTLNLQNPTVATREAQRMGNALKSELRSWDIRDLRIIGPAPSSQSPNRGSSSWSINILGLNPHILLEKINLPHSWKVDVDPY